MNCPKCETAMRKHSIGVAVAGLGNVGVETVRLLQANRAKFEARLGGGLDLRWVCDLAPGAKARRPYGLRQDR